MKTLLRNIATCLLLCGAVAAQAQWEGSMTPINLDRTPEAVPDSLTGVGVVRVARHGARFLTSDKTVEELRGLLTEAQGAGRLSADGASFLRLLNDVASTTAGRWGQLTPLGYQEESALAEQFAHEHPELLTSGRIVARSTAVLRAHQSMQAFVSRLAALAPSLAIDEGTEPQYDPLLRFFDTDAQFLAFLKDGTWSGIYEEFVKKEIPTGPAKRLFTKTSGLTKEQERATTMKMYAVLSSLQAAGITADVSQYMKSGELSRCHDAANLRHWLQRTSTRYSAVPATAAAPLLERVIDDADNMGAEGSDTRSYLYFAHAETLLPLLSLMQIPGINRQFAEPKDLIDEWDDTNFIPLGAYLDVELYRGPSGHVYASLVLNGERIYPAPGAGKVMSWPQLKCAWQSAASGPAAGKPF